MNRLEDLLCRISDRSLREALRDEIRRTHNQPVFGLAFERHAPELAILHGITPRVGCRVRFRTAPKNDQIFSVVQVDDQLATISTPEGRQVQTVPVRDLLVVKSFGEPIYPTLRPLGAVHRGEEGRPSHAVINAENFHALQLLLYLYEQQVDVIYIDPPYNTGAKDWKYNNRYVDSNDHWRHSKWLSFMERRLRLARRLLKPDGVLIVTIDEHEVMHLGMLLEQVMGDYLRYMVTIIINPKGTGKANFGRVEEHALFCVPDIGHDLIPPKPIVGQRVFNFEQLMSQVAAASEQPEEAGYTQPVESHEQGDNSDEADGEDDQYEYWHLRRRGEESSYRRQRPNQFYAVVVDERERRVISIGPSLSRDDPYQIRRTGNQLTVYPIDSAGGERVWRYSRPTMQTYIDRGEIVVGKYNPKQDTYTLNHRKPKSLVRRLKTVWVDAAYDAGHHGTNVVKNLLGQPGLFPFPKSVYAVRDCIAAVVRNRPEALILDFFAGSGTTLHATALLNAEDGGRRQCILVTNNEVDPKTAMRLNKQGLFAGDNGYERYGIFEQVTRPRCEAVITGLRPDGTLVPGKHMTGRPFAHGFPENINFYRLEYLDPDSVEVGQQFAAVQPLLWLMSGAKGPPMEEPWDAPFWFPQSCPFAVLFDDRLLPQFERELSVRSDIRRVFLVTDSEEAYAEMCQRLGGRWRTMMLYRDYLRSFQVNVEGAK